MVLCCKSRSVTADLWLAEGHAKVKRGSRLGTSTPENFRIAGSNPKVAKVRKLSLSSPSPSYSRRRSSRLMSLNLESGFDVTMSKSRWDRAIRLTI